MDIDEMETINIELEHSVAKLLSENENLRKERDHLKLILKDQFDSIKKTRVQSKEHSDSLIVQINAKSVENSDLNAQLQEKVFAIASLKNELRKLKGKSVVDTAVSKPSAVTIAPRMFKINLKPLSPKTNSLKFQDSNKPLLHPTGVNSTTSARGSKPSGNTNKNRIPPPSSSNKKNKVEEHSRSIKSRKKKMNRVDKTVCNAHDMQSVLNANSISEPICNTLVKHFIRNAKFESMYAICNKCLFDANHDICVIDHANDVNVCSKTKSKRRIFTIVGNRYPLTRITSELVPPKESTIALVITSDLKVYSRRPKTLGSIGSSSKTTIVESLTSNTKKPNQSWGSTISDTSSSLIDDRLSKSFCGIWTPGAPST
ncbi:hypothetical protein Tco_0071977 [Tanacetum coccineum]